MTHKHHCSWDVLVLAIANPAGYVDETLGKLLQTLGAWCISL